MSCFRRAVAFAAIVFALVLPITLYSGLTAIRTNDDWCSSENPADIAAVASHVGAFPLAYWSYDSALLVSLPAGAYTVVMSGVSGGTGIG